VAAKTIAQGTAITTLVHNELNKCSTLYCAGPSPNRGRDASRLHKEHHQNTENSKLNCET
jgi:hypothetical protein